MEQLTPKEHPKTKKHQEEENVCNVSYRFIRKFGETKGVHIPHDWNVSLSIAVCNRILSVDPKVQKCDEHSHKYSGRWVPKV